MAVALDGAPEKSASAKGPVRIGNCSGFYGDRLSAMREMLTGGKLDYLTGDYLAELTMLILGRDRMKHPERGYARTFLTQLEDCLGLARDNGVRIVVNAGGLNPAGLADAVRALAEKLGIPTAVAHVEGDDLLPRAAELGFPGVLTANAYLGAWGIVECLNSGADIVVTGRVTDASVVVGATGSTRRSPRVAPMTPTPMTSSTSATVPAVTSARRMRSLRRMLRPRSTIASKRASGRDGGGKWVSLVIGRPPIRSGPVRSCAPADAPGPATGGS